MILNDKVFSDIGMPLSYRPISPLLINESTRKCKDPEVNFLTNKNYNNYVQSY